MYDSKNRIEFGVAILHGGFRYGVYLGKVVSAAISTETTADFLFYLYLPHPSFTCVILIRYVKVCNVVSARNRRINCYMVTLSTIVVGFTPMSIDGMPLQIMFQHK